MPNELKPCPFCGVELVVREELWRNPHTNGLIKQKIYCHPQRNCILDFHRFHFEAHPHHIEEWNRRVDNV